jgi:hypothetical protein
MNLNEHRTPNIELRTSNCIFDVRSVRRSAFDVQCSVFFCASRADFMDSRTRLSALLDARRQAR